MKKIGILLSAAFILLLGGCAAAASQTEAAQTQTALAETPAPTEAPT